MRNFFVVALLFTSPAIGETYIRCDGIEVEKVISDEHSTRFCETGIAKCSTPSTKFYIITDEDVLDVRTGDQIVKPATGLEAMNSRFFSENLIKFLAISKGLQRASDGSVSTMPISRKSIEIDRVTGKINEFQWSNLFGSSEFTGVCNPISSTPKF